MLPFRTCLSRDILELLCVVQGLWLAVAPIDAQRSTPNTGKSRSECQEGVSLPTIRLRVYYFKYKHEAYMRIEGMRPMRRCLYKFTHVG